MNWKDIREAQSCQELYILVAGTRTFNDYKLLEKTLDSLIASCPFDKIRVNIIEGGAKGADELAAKYALGHNHYVHEYYADWSKWGRAAGPIRNRKMHEFIKDYKYRVCICFWDGKSRGTKDNFHLAKEFNTPLKIIRY